MGDTFDTDLALADVYSQLDRAQMSPPDQLRRDFIYSLIRLAYHTGRADGIHAVSSKLRENGYDT